MKRRTDSLPPGTRITYRANVEAVVIVEALDWSEAECIADQAALLFANGKPEMDARFPDAPLIAIWGGIADPKTFVNMARILNVGQFGTVTALFKGLAGDRLVAWRGIRIDEEKNVQEVAIDDCHVSPIAGLARSLFAMSGTAIGECRALGAAEAPNQKGGECPVIAPSGNADAAPTRAPRPNTLHPMFQKALAQVRGLKPSEV